MSNEQPLFDELCRRRLGATIQVQKERGDQYGNTLENCQWLVTISVMRQLSRWGYILDVPQPEVARAIAIAGLVDVKYQRFEGGYNEDHIDDGINYSAVLAELMDALVPEQEDL
jgi:hypothetical protein